MIAQRLLPTAAVALVCLTLLLGTAAFMRHGWLPVTDSALLELKIAAIPDEWPLLGAWSRFGWDHPGPAQTYWLALFYFASGKSSLALVLGTALGHLIALVVAWWVAAKRDAVLGMIVLAALLAALLARLPYDFLIPWNPYVGLAAFGTLVILGWDTSERGPAGALLLLPLGSYLLQSHVGFVPGVALVVLASLALMLLPRRTESIPWRWLIGGVVTSVILWLPPMIQQLTQVPGNLTALLGARDGEVLGPTAALQALMHGYALPPTWFRSDTYVLADGWSVPILLLLPIAAVVVGLIRRNGTQLRLLTVSLMAVLGALVALSQIKGGAYEYLVSWCQTAVLLNVGISVWVLVAGCSEKVQRVALAVATALAILIAGLLAWSVAATRIEPYGQEVAVAQLWPAFLADAGHDAVWMNSDATWDSLAVQQGLLLQARKHGIDATSDNLVADISDPRLAAPRGNRTAYRVVTLTGPAFQPPRGWRTVAVADPFTATEWARINRLNRELTALPADDPASVGRLAEVTKELTARVAGRSAVALIREDVTTPPG